jgi:hypothetical protein
MVEAGEGLRADELSGRDQARPRGVGQPGSTEPRGARVKGHRGQPGAERRYVDTLRAAFDVPPGLCEWPAYDRPSTTFPLTLRPGARPEVSDEPDRPVSR